MSNCDARFDDVKIGDKIRWSYTFHDWSGGSTCYNAGTVSRITANTIYISTGQKITRKRWGSFISLDAA